MHLTKSEFSHLYSKSVLALTNHTLYRDVNIISYKESFFEDSTSCLCIVMEYADGGDLFNKITSYKKSGKFIPEKEVWHIFIQIIRGL
jgi:serine/threonine protein kinase